MKKLTDELRKNINFAYHGILPTKMKWTDIYDNEKELISDLKSITIKDGTFTFTNGYEYLKSFQKRLLDYNKSLTDKQITQLKRLATSVAFEKYIRQ